MPDFEKHRAELFAHYLALARHPGWKAYAWQRVQQMGNEAHGLYADFPERLTAAMQQEEPREDHRV
jgi:hypothetical protein